MIFSIFRKRRKGLYSNKQLKQLIASIKKGGRPALMGLGLSRAQAAKIKEALGGADDEYYWAVIASHIVADEGRS